MTTTTAAFDCQSKPNHITMIGAMPTIGSAETKLPSGSRPRAGTATRSIRIATRKPAPQPIGVAGEHRLEEGLDGSRRRASAASATKRARDARSAAAGAPRGTPKPRTSDFPEEQQRQRRRARGTARSTSAAPSRPRGRSAARRVARGTRRRARRRATSAQKPSRPARHLGTADEQPAPQPMRERRPIAPGAADQRRGRDRRGERQRGRAADDEPATAADARRSAGASRPSGSSSATSAAAAPRASRAARRAGHAAHPSRRSDERGRRAPTRAIRTRGARSRRRTAPPRSARSGRSRSRRAGARRARPSAPVGSSPTMAPTRLIATATFRLANRNGTEAGQRSFQKICAAAGVIGAHQVELHRIGRAQPLHHADRDREEATDRSRSAPSGSRPVMPIAAEHDDDHRRDRQDRDGLRGDDPGHQAAVERCATCTISDGEQRCRATVPSGEAEQRRRERDPGVVDEAALRAARPLEHGACQSSTAIWCGAGSSGRSWLRCPRRARSPVVGVCRRPRESVAAAARSSGSRRRYQIASDAAAGRRRTGAAAPAHDSDASRGAHAAGRVPSRERLNPHRNAPPAGPRARGARSPGIPASRGCRACARAAESSR